MAGLFWGAEVFDESKYNEVRERRPITLRCKCNSHTGTVKWVCGNKEYTEKNQNPNYETSWIDKELSLKINCVAESDGGQYVCEAHTWRGIKRSLTMTLKVLDIIKYPRQQYMARVYRPIVLDCEITNQTKPGHTFYWKHNSKDIDLTSGRHTQFSGTRLKISNICTQDEGTYECLGTTTNYSFPPDPTKSIRLEVSLEVFIERDKYDAPIHSSVTLECQAPGAYTCKWKHNGNEIHHTRFKINDDMSLTISPVRYSDAGRYVCMIKDRNNKRATSEEVLLCATSPTYGRCFPDSFENSIAEDTIERLVQRIPDNRACIWFIGGYGAGKSSAISSFHSSQEGRISIIALPGNTEGRFTTETFRSQILEGKVTLYDFPGLEGNLAVGANQHSHTPFDDITRNVPEGDPLKCCVVYVLDSSEPITDQDVSRMKYFRDYTKQKGNLQMVVLLTKIDKASQRARTVREMLESQKVCDATKQIYEKVGVNDNCIFAIYNYHNQMEMDSEMNLLILYTLRGLLERLLDIYRRIENSNATPR